MTRYLVLYALSAVLAATPQAQMGGTGTGPALAIGSERFPIRITTLGSCQRYESDEAEITQVTLPVTLTLPIGRNLSLRLRGAYGTVDGDTADGEGLGDEQSPTGNALASVSGLADAQVGLSYYRPVGNGSLVASATVNVPSGQSMLSAEEARTAFLLGQGFYGFQLSNFGQGLNVAPALTWAIPLGDRFAAGFGIAYQVRGAFEPRIAVEGIPPVKYNPGNELLLTAGLDYRLGRRSTGGRVSLDGTFALYGTDTFGGMEFETGDALTLTAQWAGTLSGHEARLIARFRDRGESTFPDVEGVVVGTDAVVPTSVRVRGEIRFQLGRRFLLGSFVQGRYYAASDIFAEKKIVDFGSSPEVEITQRLTLLLQASLTFWDLAGFNVGGGLSWSL